jgi:hypothetical protein
MSDEDSAVGCRWQGMAGGGIFNADGLYNLLLS